MMKYKFNINIGFTNKCEQSITEINNLETDINLSITLLELSNDIDQSITTLNDLKQDIGQSITIWLI